ncbi:MAG: POTRA domain-containing protein [Flammeovirgaceae bacterium]
MQKIASGWLCVGAVLFATILHAQTNADTTQVQPGNEKLVTVGRVMIIGNKKTKDRIISRELTLKPGDTIRMSKIAETLLWDKRKIYNLRLFNVVSIRILETSPNTIDLLVEVEERWYTWPAPIFELSDRNFNEWWQNYNHDFNRVNYGIKLDQYNVRGRNETLRLQAQFGFSQRFELSYTIPYIDRNQKQGLVFEYSYGNPRNLAFFTNDHKLEFARSSTALRTSQAATIGYTYRKNFFETHQLSIGYRSSVIKDTVANLNENYFGGQTDFKQNYANIQYQFKSEHRDVILYPLKGYQITVTLQRNGLGFEGNVNQWIANATYAHHWDLGKQLYLSNFTAGYLSNPDQPYNLFSALGYQRQIVRGYEVYVIEGPRFIVNKTTFKKRIFSKTWRWEEAPLEQFRHMPFAIYLKVFGDWGYVENYPYYQDKQINTRLANKMLAGYGSGFDLVMPYDVVFRFEYTFTAEGTQGFVFNIKKEF